MDPTAILLGISFVTAIFSAFKDYRSGQSGRGWFKANGFAAAMLVAAYVTFCVSLVKHREEKAQQAKRDQVVDTLNLNTRRVLAAVLGAPVTKLPSQNDVIIAGSVVNESGTLIRNAKLTFRSGDRILGNLDAADGYFVYLVKKGAPLEIVYGVAEHPAGTPLARRIPLSQTIETNEDRHVQLVVSEIALPTPDK